MSLSPLGTRVVLVLALLAFLFGGDAWRFVVAFLDVDASLTQVKAAYKANCLYAVNGSLVECQQFIQACHFMLEFAKPETRQGSAALREDPGIYERKLAQAEAWLSSRDSDYAGSAGGGVVFADLSGVRD